MKNEGSDLVASYLETSGPPPFSKYSIMPSAHQQLVGVGFVFIGPK